jgi:hypothetical protein
LEFECRRNDLDKHFLSLLVRFTLTRIAVFLR